MVFKLEQSLKALTFRDVIPSGITIEVIPLQPQNVLFFIALAKRELGILKVFRFEQP